ncbi:MAG: DUF1801 domain-containing protein [Bacteroidota bacterium]
MKPEVAQKFDNYPDGIKPKMLALRQMIIDVAQQVDNGRQPEESLKWGEPSYKSKKGSPVRIDWKTKAPEQYAVYFNCSTSLVGTFRIIYEDTFEFEGNRAIILKLDQPVPEKALRHCLELALNYHNIKHLPMLGA